MAQTKKFFVFKGSKAEFIAKNYHTTYKECIVHITGGTDTVTNSSGTQSPRAYVFIQGQFLTDPSLLKFVSGVKLNGTNYEISPAGGASLAFANSDTVTITYDTASGAIKFNTVQVLTGNAGTTVTTTVEDNKIKAEVNEGSLESKHFVADTEEDINAIGGLRTVVNSETASTFAANVNTFLGTDKKDLVTYANKTRTWGEGIDTIIGSGPLNTTSTTLKGAINELKGTSSDTKETASIEGVKKYVDDKTANIASSTTVSELRADITELLGEDYETVNGTNRPNNSIRGIAEDVISAIEGSQSDGDLVNVEVETSGGKVTLVTVDETELNSALDGKADLDESGHILATQLPDYILGQVMFGGTIPTITSTNYIAVTPSTNFTNKYGAPNSIPVNDYAQYEGVYFIAEVDGTLTMTGKEPISYSKGDWIISTGTTWTKVDNTDAVTTVVGQTGAITAEQIKTAISLSDYATNTNLDKKVAAPTSTVTANTVAVFDGTTGKAIKSSGFTIASSVPQNAKFTDTTYTGSDGITLTGTNFTNSGVRSVATGATNGTIKVNTNGTEAEVSVAGLGTAAYTAADAYMPVSASPVINSALQTISLSSSGWGEMIGNAGDNNLTVSGPEGDLTLSVPKDTATTLSDNAAVIPSSKLVKTYVDSLWEWEELS